MIRFHIPAGVAALAVSLASVLAPVQTATALAQSAEQTSEAAPATQEIQPPTDEIVPRFVARPVVQPLPEAAATAEAAIPQAKSLRDLVASMDERADLDEQLKCLAGAIYFEARGEPLAGQLAVAEVVINRAASGRFPASYCGVVLQRSQFSFVKRGRMPSLPDDGATWRRAKAIAQIAHRGLWDSEAEGSLYFHARSVSPGWSNRRQAMARISNHVFYR